QAARLSAGLPPRAARITAARLRAGLPSQAFIVYRRLTMNAVEPLDREAAEEYASWFAALADGTRVQIVSLLARSGVPMTVGQIVACVEVGQSTVSAHLKRLAEVGFVKAEHRGTASLYRINEACVECFPTAADVVMGRPVPVTSSAAG
ncbi:MAG TPA: metalloregulator ArsR/SmtB family transcription factor, partial [Streptosporangiaceae bacterium]|nr:metalloregulator ArsR/SmtB family transcription factor [Streptosporangiaceae bacterium]